ncbi:uncharacterized protein [Ptychodera flava]|uniref:uncharacterized protein n=1 Tax=Ptychodera flava TaxID=63121 RepID=UPI003969E334
MSEGNSAAGGNVTPLDIGGLTCFNVNEDHITVSQRWKKWRRAFELYLVGKGVTAEAQKRALLLHTAGLEVQEIYFTLVGEDSEKNYEDTLQVLNNHFVPKANIPFERHMFRQIAQTSDETVDQFVCRLRQRASTCDFAEKEDEHIRDQLIDKCYSPHIRRKFLEKQNAKLSDLLVIAHAQEAVDLQMQSMGERKPQVQVNAVG